MCFTRRRQYAFSVRVVLYWNSLPEKIVNASLVDARWQSLKLPSNPSRQALFLPTVSCPYTVFVLEYTRSPGVYLTKTDVSAFASAVVNNDSPNIFVMPFRRL